VCEVGALQRGTVQSPELSDALAEIYLGRDPPAPAMQQDFLNTVSSLISNKSASSTAGPADTPTTVPNAAAPPAKQK
jgi:hypothetical protein